MVLELLAAGVAVGYAHTFALRHANYGSAADRTYLDYE